MPQGTFSFQRYPAFYIRLQLIYAKLVGSAHKNYYGISLKVAVEKSRIKNPNEGQQEIQKFSRS